MTIKQLESSGYILSVRCPYVVRIYGRYSVLCPIHVTISNSTHYTVLVQLQIENVIVVMTMTMSVRESSRTERRR